MDLSIENESILQDTAPKIEEDSRVNQEESIKTEVVNESTAEEIKVDDEVAGKTTKTDFKSDARYNYLRNEGFSSEIFKIEGKLVEN